MDAAVLTKSKVVAAVFPLGQEREKEGRVGKVWNRYQRQHRRELPRRSEGIYSCPQGQGRLKEFRGVLRLRVEKQWWRLTFWAGAFP